MTSDGQRSDLFKSRMRGNPLGEDWVRTDRRLRQGVGSIKAGSVTQSSRSASSAANRARTTPSRSIGSITLANPRGITEPDRPTVDHGFGMQDIASGSGAVKGDASVIAHDRIEQAALTDIGRSHQHDSKRVEQIEVRAGQTAESLAASR